MRSRTSPLLSLTRVRRGHPRSRENSPHGAGLLEGKDSRWVRLRAVTDWPRPFV